MSFSSPVTGATTDADHLRPVAILRPFYLELRIAVIRAFLDAGLFELVVSVP